MESTSIVLCFTIITLTMISSTLAGPRGGPVANGVVGEAGPEGPAGYRSCPKWKFENGEITVSSCKELKSKFPDCPSDEYRITLWSGAYKVYCEMAIDGGGYTFIPDALVSQLSTYELSELYTDHQSVLLRISRPDGTQPYTLIEQQRGQSGGLIVKIDSYSVSQPANHNLGPYLYLSTGDSSSSYTGFISNGKFIYFYNCDGNKNAYFAFFPNPDEKPVSTYHNNNLRYERQGVCPNWRKSAINPKSGRRIPLRYFFFTEIGYGGCGCYTSSDRWLSAVSPALGTAIGIR